MPKLSDYFFWLKWMDVIIIGSFWWVIFMAVIFWVPFLRPWWWLFLPFFLSIELKKLYLWWLQWDYNYANRKWVFLEIVPPKEILMPLKAMEDVFSIIWPTIYSPSVWREEWCEGMLPHAAEWMSFEVSSIEGKVHFYMRVAENHRSSIETALYSHYPELEIQEVKDYTRDIPQNIPNEEWDVYGENFILGRQPSAYPIKTYEKFFEPQGEKISAEEKRIDPMSSLLELMSKLGKGEQFWLQFILMSVDDKNDEPLFKKEADEIISKISKRPAKKPSSSFMGGWLSDLTAAFHLIFGGFGAGSDSAAAVSSAQSESGEREMVLTPGEREVLTEIENKIKKPIFRTVIRGVYVARRENFKSTNKYLTRAYFSHFQTQNMNFIRFSVVTRPKTHYVFRKRIPYVRSRRMLRNFILRFTPLFPNRNKECLILNTEEMATVFHFPFKIVGVAIPSTARVESKKAGPPPNLPTE